MFSRFADSEEAVEGVGEEEEDKARLNICAHRQVEAEHLPSCAVGGGVNEANCSLEP